MLPGYIAGHYSYDEVHIDLAPAGAASPARAFSTTRRWAWIAPRARCSAAAGRRCPTTCCRSTSAPRRSMDDVPGAAEHAVPVKPINNFNARWLALLERVRRHAGVTRIAVVGARRGRRRADARDAVPAAQRTDRRSAATRTELRFHLLTAGAAHPAHPQCGGAPRLRARARRARRRDALQRRGAPRVGGRAADRGGRDDRRRRNRLGDARRRRALAARHRPRTGRATDSCRSTRRSQTVSDPKVFAAGDIASMVGPSAREGGRVRGAPGPAAGATTCAARWRASRSRPTARSGAGSR